MHHKTNFYPPHRHYETPAQTNQHSGLLIGTLNRDQQKNKENFSKKFTITESKQGLYLKDSMQHKGETSVLQPG